MLLQDILKAKGSTVHWIGPQATLADAVRELVDHRLGALLVGVPEPNGGARLVGILSERDLLYAHAGKRGHLAAGTAAGKCPWMDCKVADLMTSELITASPDDSVEQIMGLMTTKRIRHLPVLAEGRVVGIVSIGDIVKAQHDHLAVENRFMKDYIGRPL
ncbi:MAG: CBS domain-containing protein [Thermoguttaceae bacterium]